MINLIPPEIDFLEILGVNEKGMQEIFLKSESENDFIEYFDVDECIEQLDLEFSDKIELKNSINYFLLDFYSKN